MIESPYLIESVRHNFACLSSSSYSIRAAGRYVKHVHLNETNHREIGTGHADYKAIIKALKDIDYDGYLALYMPYTSQEIMTSKGYGQSELGGTGQRLDLKAYLEKPLKYLKEVEAIVEMESEIYTTE